MEHIPKSQAEVIRNPTVTSWEYLTQSEAMNVALIHIHGRYPEEGFTSNTVVDSIIQVMKGSGVVETPDGTRIALAAGDQLHLGINEAYFFEGEFEIIYAATPKWTPEQTEHLT